MRLITTPFPATLVVETYNLIEGTDRDRFREALRTAVAAAEAIQGEVLVTDACGGEEVRRIVAAAAAPPGEAGHGDAAHEGDRSCQARPHRPVGAVEDAGLHSPHGGLCL
jgi:hypothetical protein